MSKDVLFITGLIFLVKGDDQIVICTKDSQGYIHVRNMFVGGQTPQNIVRDRPLYGLYDADAYSNATHIVCKFTRSLSANTDERDSESASNRQKVVNLKEPHFMYPIYSDQDLMTPQGNH